MNSNGPSGRVTSATGSVVNDRAGEPLPDVTALARVAANEVGASRPVAGARSVVDRHEGAGLRVSVARGEAAAQTSPLAARDADGAEVNGDQPSRHGNALFAASEPVRHGEFEGADGLVVAPAPGEGEGEEQDDGEAHALIVTTSAGNVNASTGDVDLDGQLLGRVRECGTSLLPFPWSERPGFHERMEAAGQDPDAMRHLIKHEVTP